MSGVDNRIVTMQFNNRNFETNARTSLSTLQKLKESMNFGSIVGGTVKGLGAIDGALSKLGLRTPFSPMIQAANKGLGMVGGVLDRLGLKNPFSGGIQSASELQRAAQAAGGPSGMGVLEGGVTSVSNKFLALSTIAITALSNITNRAINAGTSFLKSFTFAPIQQGLHEYETNLKSIQTVQANTDQPLDKVNRSLEELNKYSDQTIYNFSEMARNVGTFTAAGVDLETSVSSIKGIANLAALSGSSSEQAASAMYQLSQAIAAGKVGLMDWNSVVNAGMGGKKLQNALAQTAVAMGELDKEQVKLVGSMQKLEINGSSFRESIMAKPGQESWLSSEALVNTLSVMDGRFSQAALAAEKTEEGLRKYSDAQIKAKIETARMNLEQKNGVKYTDEQFEALQKMSTAAFKSATEVKTLGQVWDILKETIGSGWSASFKNIFGDLKEAKKTFTAMKDELAGIIELNALERNKMLNAWKEGGGRQDVIDGIKNAWMGVLGILGPIREGFRDIFPAQTADSLLEMSERFREWSASLIPSKAAMADIRDIAGGVFAIFGIGKTILFAVVDGIQALFSAVGGGSGNFLSFGASVGDVLKKFNDFLAESGVVTAFFESLGRILAVPLSLLSGLAGIFSGIFGGFDEGAAAKVGGAVDAVGERLSGLQIVGERIRNFFIGVGEFFGNLGEHIGKALVGIGDVVAGAFTADTFGSTLDVINTTLLGGLVLLIRNFFNKGVSVDLTGGLFDGIKETLGEATGAFQNMQNTLKADILLKLGAAIAVMAGALLILSMIDPGALSKALVAMGAGFGILIGAMAALMKFLGAAGLVQMYVVTSAMTKMAFSILLLSFALKTLSKIKFGDMIKGLIGLSVMMAVMTKAMVPLAAGSKGMAKAAWSLMVMGVALNILAVALKIFASMSWEEMGRGLAGLAGTLLALSVGLKLMPPLQAEAIGLVALGLALNLLAVALKIFATMSWTDMAKGLVMLAGSLAIISVAIKSMPKTMMLQSVALVAVAGALVVLAGALKIMGSMSWESVAQGLVLLGGALGIIAIGLNAIGLVGTIGAIGLLAAAGALAILAPIMVTLGALSWESIVKGLVGLAGVFVIIGVAGYLLAPVIPIILGLGAALLLMGAGLALAGVGALAAATAFGIVVAAGLAGAQVLAHVLATIISSIPPAMAAFGKGVVQFAVAIGKGAPKIATAFGKVLENILDQVIKNAPKLAKAFLAMLNAGLRVIVVSIPKIANAGLRLIVGFLEAISRHIPRITTLAADIIVKFINGIAKNIGRIIQAGVNLIIRFIEGLTRAINNNSARLGEAGADLALALINGMADGLSAMAGRVVAAAQDVGRRALNAFTSIFDINSPSKETRKIGEFVGEGLSEGLRSTGRGVERSAEGVGRTAISALQRTMSGVSDAFALDPNFNPTVTPVLDLTGMTKEANKMSQILAVAPIMPGVSYRAAADISAMTQASAEATDQSGGPGGGSGDTYVTLEQHNHSPKALDSVQIYRDGKSLISLVKETLS